MSNGPLAGVRTGVGGGGPAGLTGVLLAGLTRTVGLEGAAGLEATRAALAGETVDEAGEWARTGLRDDPLSRPVGAPATLARALAAGIRLLSPLSGDRVTVDGPATLGERAALLGLPSAGRRSSGGSAQLIAAADGWLAVNLPRPDDEDLVPALIEGRPGADHWAAIRAWAQHRRLVEVDSRAALLGLAVGALRYPLEPVVPWRLHRVGGGPRVRPGRALVVNLGSLWAAPLCAQLLRRAGHHVVDVESPQRPDGARLGTPDFYARLHEGHERTVLDLTTAPGRAELRELLADADVVLTGSRPTALRRLGAVPEPSATRARLWIAITGYGGESNRVAFGDDAAVAGGLVRWREDRTPVFAGDALADPLAGLAAAMVAFAGLAGLGALADTGGWLADVSLRDIAAFASRLPSGPGSLPA